MREKMLEIAHLAETSVAMVLQGLHEIYAEIDEAQGAWKNVSPFHCSDGCGSCCVDFEPDVLESEALYLGAWLLYHHPSRAQSIAEGLYISPRDPSQKGCFLFDPLNPNHCTVYGGRVLICRLFAYTGDRGKDGLPRWKPCKFLPIQDVERGETRRRHYSYQELLEKFGAFPPIMSDISASVAALSPSLCGTRYPLREILPKAINTLRMIERFCLPNNDPAPVGEAQ